MKMESQKNGLERKPKTWQALSLVEFKSFIGKYNPRSIDSRLHEISCPSECVNEGAPSLTNTSKKIGIEATRDLICFWIVDLQKAIGVKRSMDQDGIEDCALLMVTDPRFKKLNLADVFFFFKRAKYGFYGKYYQSFSFTDFQTILESYFEDRCEQSQQKEHDNSQQNKIRDTVPLKSVGDAYDKFGSPEDKKFVLEPTKTEEEKNREALHAYNLGQAKGDLSSLGVLPRDGSNKESE